MIRISRVLIGVIVVLILLGIGLVWAGYIPLDFLKQRVPPAALPGGVIERTTDLTKASIERADISGVSLLLPQADKPVQTTADAREAFDAAHLNYSFKLATNTVEYLVSIIDSERLASEPFKSIAAYSLLHTYYDTGDLAFMVRAVDKSSFMREQVRPRAMEIFPEVFQKPIDALNATERRKYFVSHLLALMDRDDSAAIPATAATELAILFRNDTGAERATYRAYLQNAYKTAITRLSSRLYANSEPVSAHDTVVGINHLAISKDYLAHTRLLSVVPETASYNIVAMLPISYEIAQKEVPSLEMFTAYLNAWYGSKYLPKSQENDSKVDAYVRDIVGTPPFESVSTYSWATRRFIGAEDAPYTSVYRRQNIVLVASRSVTLQQFLRQKDGWTDADFQIVATSTNASGE